MADTQEILLTVTCPAFPDTFQVDSISGHEELGELFSYSVVLASSRLTAAEKAKWQSRRFRLSGLRERS